MAKRKQNKKGLVSLLTLFLSISMFVTSTYAWFTDTAEVKGSKIMAGNLNLEVIVDAEDLYKMFPEWDTVAYNENATADGKLDEDEIKYGFLTDYEISNTDLANKYTYTRTFSGTTGDSKNYYIISEMGKDMSIVNLCNVEPGQSYPVSLKVLNTGDLAIGYTASMSVDKDESVSPATLKSYTGLETLYKAKDGTDKDGFGYYAGAYQVQTSPANTINNQRAKGTFVDGTAMSDEDFGYRLGKLLKLQTGMDATAIASQLASPGDYSSVKNADRGLKLEQVLEVYAVDKADPLQYDAGKILLSGVLAEDKDGNKLHLIGTVEDIMNGKCADKMAQNSSGLCLPQADLTSDDNFVPKDGVTVLRYDETGAPVTNDPDTDADESKYTGIKEYGEVTYIIHMPETVYALQDASTKKYSIKDADGNRYTAETKNAVEVSNLFQNASVRLNVGASASQVDYEFDGVGFMLYDAADRRNPKKTTTTTTD